MSRFEALPEDILVRIVCCVEHDDLKQLLLVSKKIKDAVISAKKEHFEFSTPASRKSVLTPFSDLEDESKFQEAPAAPKKKPGRQHSSRYDSKRHVGISIDLFAKMEI